MSVSTTVKGVRSIKADFYGKYGNVLPGTVPTAQHVVLGPRLFRT